MDYTKEMALALFKHNYVKKSDLSPEAVELGAVSVINQLIEEEFVSESDTGYTLTDIGIAYRDASKKD